LVLARVRENNPPSRIGFISRIARRALGDTLSPNQLSCLFKRDAFLAIVGDLPTSHPGLLIAVVVQQLDEKLPDLEDFHPQFRNRAFHVDERLIVPNWPHSGHPSLQQPLKGNLTRLHRV
jgi:hypothetical protein